MANSGLPPLIGVKDKAVSSVLQAIYSRINSIESGSGGGSKATYNSSSKTITNNTTSDEFAATEGNIAKILAAVSGQITQDKLWKDLSKRIDYIDAPETNLNSVNARIAAAQAVNGAKFIEITDSIEQLQTLDETLVKKVNEILVVDAGQASDIYLEQLARISADEVQATQILQLTSRMSTAEANISSESTARATATEAFTQQLNTQISQINSVDGKVTLANATIASNYTTLTNANTALSNSVTQLKTRLDGVGEVGLEQAFAVAATRTGALEAQYTVKIDNNGYVSGFGLASTSTSSGANARFYVNAQTFAVGDANADKANSILPFVITDGNVYIKEAMIGKLTAAKISSGTAKLLDGAAEVGSFGFGSVGGDLVLIDGISGIGQFTSARNSNFGLLVANTASGMALGVGTKGNEYAAAFVNEALDDVGGYSAPHRTYVALANQQFAINVVVGETYLRTTTVNGNITVTNGSFNGNLNGTSNDSGQLNGQSASYYATADHSHASEYLGINSTAAAATIAAKANNISATGWIQDGAVALSLGEVLVYTGIVGDPSAGFANPPNGWALLKTATGTTVKVPYWL
jgi:hypothetical protein